MNQMVEFHVTSLDVIHSFWAYQLGVKADANPDVDNIVFVKPTRDNDLRSPLRRAVRHLARRHVRPRPRRERAARSAPGSTNSRRSSRRRPRCCPPTARPTYPNRRGEADEHDDRICIYPPAHRAAAVAAAGRLQPADRGRCSASAATTSAGSSATRSPTVRATTTRRRTTKTTSRCCSPTSSAWSAS